MGSHKSKEDDVSKISTSIFIINFPVTFSAKDLIDRLEVTEWVPDFLEESHDEHDSDDDVNEGDLNAVDSDVDEIKSERFGLNFNVQGANVFNSFIVNAGLEEIPLATSLERYLSDHRPILLPLWNESIAMSIQMKKLKYLKQKIRDWNKGNMKSSKNIKAKLKDDLKAVDDIIDNGEGNDEVVKLRRMS
ncbi:hypothetical protein Tco_0977994 [Tanacetum coccineum]|uniref:RNA-directed DNA polymerase, eukaryota n=1 Tax=Tanacetum coccineum TaxID=301880 RepID=A0ABQ5EMR8_9ASTR